MLSTRNLKFLHYANKTLFKYLTISVDIKEENNKDKKLGQLKMEFEMLKYEMIAQRTLSQKKFSDDASEISFIKIPEEVEDKDWEYLLTLPGKAQRIKYYRYLFKNEMAKKNLEEKKEAKRLQRLQEREEKIKAEGDHLHYGLNGNTLMYFIREPDINRSYTWNLVKANIANEPNLVVDFSLEDKMNTFEKGETANQIREMLQFNRLNRFPFNITFTGCKGVPSHNKFRASPTSQHYADNENVMKDKKEEIKNLINANNDPNQSSVDSQPLLCQPLINIVKHRLIEIDNFLVNYTAKSYLDLYPRDTLIYLSPNGENYMEKWDPYATYILGGIVEKSVIVPYTLAISKRQKIRCLRLPIDKYLRWGLGKKDLTLNQVIAILLDYKNTGSWDIAFRHIPRRKLFNYQKQLENEDKRFNNIVQNKF